MLFYESFDPKNWGEGINVAFADGHVELIHRREAFEQMLKQAPKAGETPANPPGAPAKP